MWALRPHLRTDVYHKQIITIWIEEMQEIHPLRIEHVPAVKESVQLSLPLKFNNNSKEQLQVDNSQEADKLTLTSSQLHRRISIKLSKSTWWSMVITQRSMQCSKKCRRTVNARTSFKMIIKPYSTWVKLSTMASVSSSSKCGIDRCLSPSEAMTWSAWN